LSVVALISLEFARRTSITAHPNSTVMLNPDRVRGLFVLVTAREEWFADQGSRALVG